MLVLSRKQGQSIRIADQITVTIVEVGRGRVRLGITAPVEVPVHREEVVLRSAEPHRPTEAVAIDGEARVAAALPTLASA